MKKIKVLILLSMFSVCCYTGPKVASVVGSALKDTSYLSAVKLISLLDDKGTRTASGFAITKDHIMTAGHFCANVYQDVEKGDTTEPLMILFVTPNHGLKSAEGGVIEAFDNEIDVCVIKLENHGVPPASFSAKQYKIYDPILTVGAPVGWFPAKQEGHIVVPRTVSIEKYEHLANKLVINDLGHSGSSGSPVFDKDGKIIGMIVRRVDEFQSIMYCVPQDALQKFINENYE